VRTAIAVVAALVGVWLAASAFLFVWPPVDTPRSADAVVVLSGKRKRLAEGLKLVRSGVARTLVISDGRAPGWRRANRLCAGNAPFRVVCFRPSPYSTQGEAEAVARIARRNDWRSLVVVSSTYHLMRARLLFERCTDAQVGVAKAPTTAGEFVRNVPVETGKLVYQLTVDRHC
jgi:uncharacterized SAM-binding protein YcdF (DUF218 family)